MPVKLNPDRGGPTGEELHQHFLSFRYQSQISEHPGKRLPSRSKRFRAHSNAH